MHDFRRGGGIASDFVSSQGNGDISVNYDASNYGRVRGHTSLRNAPL